MEKINKNKIRQSEGESGNKKTDACDTRWGGVDLPGRVGCPVVMRNIAPTTQEGMNINVHVRMCFYILHLEIRTRAESGVKTGRKLKLVRFGRSRGFAGLRAPPRAPAPANP